MFYVNCTLSTRKIPIENKIRNKSKHVTTKKINEPQRKTARKEKRTKGYKIENN